METRSVTVKSRSHRSCGDEFKLARGVALDTRVS